MATGNAQSQSNAPEIQIPCIVFSVITPLFVAARLWSRWKSVSPTGWDDWICLSAWISSQLVSSLMLGSCAHGFGQHIHTLSPHDKYMTLKLFYVAQVFYKLTLNLTKISILLLYLRIFSVHLWFRWIGLLLIGVVTAYMTAAVCATIFQCTPMARAWDRSIVGTCINIEKNWYANAWFSITTDVVILVLPMRLTITSKLPVGDKIAVLGVFLLGSFVTITSILRMRTLSFSSTSIDTTYDVASSMWTIIENNTAIICACLPMCRRPLITLLFRLGLSGSTQPRDPTRLSGAGGYKWTGFNEPAITRTRSSRCLDPERVLTQSQDQEGDRKSEEYIMSSMGGEPTADPYSKGETSVEITKNTKYEVTFAED